MHWSWADLHKQEMHSIANFRRGMLWWHDVSPPMISGPLARPVGLLLHP